MKKFVLTLRFLTRIPIPYNDCSIMPNEEFAKGIVFFPLIGLIVGLISTFVFWVASYVSYGVFPAVCAVLASIIVTGAFHIDGLADTCDGIFSSRKKERMLEIMRDSRVGTNGAIAILFDVLLKISLVYSISNPYIALILAPVAGKMITPILTLSKYARDENGLGNIYIGSVPDSYLISTVFIGAAIILILLGFYGVLPIIITLFVAFVFTKYMESKIGGMTGDTLGAGAEITEIVFLIVLAAERWFYY